MRLIEVIVISLLISGCSTLSVVTDFSEEADFSSFKTFQYKESNMSVAEASPFLHRRIVNAIKSKMVAAGLKEVSTVPDIFVTYYGEETENVIIMTTGWEYDTPSQWHNRAYRSPHSRHLHRGMYYQSTTEEVVIREGTLVIDMWETRKNELVWRAEITDTLSSSRDRNEANIKKGISRAFENFPPGSESK